MEMKQLKRCLFVSFLVFDISLKSQNLVPNGSFEILTECPNSDGQVNLALPWRGLINNSVDLYNVCSSLYNIPNQYKGYQFARTGNSMAGIITYHNGIQDFNYREYLETKLLDSLLIDNCYRINFYVNLHNGAKYATSNFGILFTTLPHIQMVDSVWNNWINNSLSTRNLSFKIIDDTSNWVKISGVFYANDYYKHIIIGNFENDLNSSIKLFNENSTIPISYYFFDDVSVIPITSENMPANAGADVLVNPGDSVFIGQEISNLNCRWFNLTTGEQIADSISGIWVSPAETTSYVVRQDLCGSITYDTVKVSVGFAGINTLNVSKNSIKVVPNPNAGSFEIKNPNKKNIHFILSNALGQVVYEEQFASPNKKLDLNIQKGIYFAIFDDGEGLWSEKVVVE
jgi:hypothetical protein